MATHLFIVEPAAISWVRHRYMDTPPLSAAICLMLSLRDLANIACNFFARCGSVEVGTECV